MTRTLFAGKNNSLKDTLEYSDDGRVTWTAVDLTAATGLTLQIYEDPDDPALEVSGLSEFTVDASGNAEWKPGAGDVPAALVGKTYKVRWIIVTSASPQGEVFEADPVQIRG